MQRMQAAIEKRNKMPESDLPEEDTNENYDSDDIEPYVEKKNKFELSFEIDDEITDRENETKHFINKMFAVLDERECDMINMYYGRLYGQAFTLEEIGDKYGLTKERVRQVIKKAFRKIRSEAILTDSHYLSSKN